MLNFTRMKNRFHSLSVFTAFCRTALSVRAAILGLALLLGMVPKACADVTVTNGQTYSIDDTNTTLSGTSRTWNETGTITPGSPSDHVKVTLPNPGTKLFVRLKVANTPP